jgi:hypothetical protein
MYALCILIPIGNIMTLSYNVGLTGGALAAYLLEKLLSPSKLRPCHIQLAGGTIPKIEKTMLGDFRNSTLKPHINKLGPILPVTATVAHHFVQDLTTQSTSQPFSDILTTIINSTVASALLTNNTTTISNNEIH